MLRDVEIRNVTSRKSKYGFLLKGYAHDPITIVRAVDCTFDGVDDGDILQGVRDIKLTNVRFNGQIRNETITDKQRQLCHERSGPASAGFGQFARRRHPRVRSAPPSTLLNALAQSRASFMSRASRCHRSGLTLFGAWSEPQSRVSAENVDCCRKNGIPTLTAYFYKW